MACKKCGRSSCGCQDQPYSTVTPPPVCPFPPLCPEYTYTGCDIYDGPAIPSICSNVGGVLSVEQPVALNPANLAGACTGYTPCTQSATSGSGTGAAFTIEISCDGLQAFDILINIPGTGYQVGDTITIPGSQVGGVDGTNDITLVVTGVTCDKQLGLVPGMSMNEVIQRLALLASGVLDLSNTCHSVTTMVISAVSASSITIGFSAVSTATYRVFVSPAGAGNYTEFGTGFPSGTTYVLITGLTTATSYDIYVLTECPSTSYISVTVRATTL